MGGQLRSGDDTWKTRVLNLERQLADTHNYYAHKLNDLELSGKHELQRVLETSMKVTNQAAVISNEKQLRQQKEANYLQAPA